MRICIFGAGYVGLVSAAVFADWGHDVTCVDSNRQKVDRIQRGFLDIFEPGLEDLLHRNLTEGRLWFTADSIQALIDCQIILIAVGTPSNEDGDPDLSAIWNVVEAIKRYSVYNRQTIIVKSTVPVGTCFAIHRFLNAEDSDRFEIIAAPEFLSQGTAISNMLSPDRLVIGCQVEATKKLVKDLYQPLQCPILFTSWESAEMIKYASNAFLAMKISYINAIADICEKTGADIEQVATGIGLDKRIGSAHLRAGVGFGGSCLKKDTRALISLGNTHSIDMSLFSNILEINRMRPFQLIDKIIKYLKELHGRRIAVLGLAFKPSTNDLRDAPALQVIERLISHGGDVKVFDPVVDLTFVTDHYPVIPAVDPYDAVRGADAAVFLTEWEEFAYLDFDAIRVLMRTPLIIDGRNQFDPRRMKQLDMTYVPVGLAPSN